ncbi:MAG: sulfur carrier protein ThiS [Cellvibrionaceae bacterium]
MLTLSLNNTPTEIPRSMSLHEALEHLNLCDERSAAAVNGEFVPRSQYRNCVLNDGDTIDIVKPVVGG